jgi:hypothetical protein
MTVVDSATSTPRIMTGTVEKGQALDVRRRKRFTLSLTQGQ